MDSQLVF